MDETNTNANTSSKRTAKIAVIGAGWWSQGWHLPALHHNPEAELVAIVDSCPHPQSPLHPHLESLDVLQQKYHTQIYNSTSAMFQDRSTMMASQQLDGVVIATPHATHYDVCREIMNELDRRRQQQQQSHKPLHIFMEKPMTTDIQHALELYRMVVRHQQQQQQPDDDTTTTTGDTTTTASISSSQFWINHSANYRRPTKLAREIIATGQLGRLRHVTACLASPLKWIFDEPACRGWNEPTTNMLGNGFAWGQSSHLWAFLYHLCPQLQPHDVYCRMTHSTVTGADVSFGATVRCRVVTTDTTTGDDTNGSGDDNNNDNNQEEYAVLSVSGTSLLPGHAHSDPPVPKLIQVSIFGDEASLHYSGNDRDPTSGRLEVRRADGTIQVVHDQFVFENFDATGSGPESLQMFVQLCCGGGNDMNCYEGASVVDGLKSIQTIDAMYRSHASSRPEQIIGLEEE